MRSVADCPSQNGATDGEQPEVVTAHRDNGRRSEDCFAAVYQVPWSYDRRQAQLQQPSQPTKSSNY